MNYASRIREEIFNTRSIEDDSVFFSLNSFYSYLKSVFDVALGELALKRRFTFDFFCDPAGSTTACTDNSVIRLNVAGPLVRSLTGRPQKYFSIVGHAVHETGHILYTDFDAHAAWMKRLMKTPFSCGHKMPDARLAKEAEDRLNTDPFCRRIFLSAARQLCNIMEDVYIENRLYGRFSGVFTLGLATVNREIYRQSPDLKILLEKIACGELDELTALLLMIQIRQLGFDVKNSGFIPAEPDEAEILERLQKHLELLDPYLEKLAWEENSRARYRLLDEALLYLLDLIPAGSPEPSGESGQSSDSQSCPQGQPDSEHAGNHAGTSAQPTGSDAGAQAGCDDTSGNGASGPAGENRQGINADSPEDRTQPGPLGNDASGHIYNKEEETGDPDCPTGQPEDRPVRNRKLTDADADRIIRSMQELLEASGSRTVTKGKTKPVDDQSGGDRERSQRGRRNAFCMRQEQMDAEASRMISRVAEEEAGRKAEHAHERELNAEAGEILNRLCRAHGVHARWHYLVERPHADEGVRYMYDEIYDSVAEYASVSKRRLKDALRVKKQEGRVGGYMTGRYDLSSSYRTAAVNDGRSFYRETAPEGKPDAAFAVLIDQSGSMHGEKIESARRTAVLLDDILKAADVPYMIAGHTDDADEVTVFMYKDFDGTDGRDSLRLACIGSCWCNRDGAAVAYCCERLLKRSERRKVLIVISDGLPCSCSYYPKLSEAEDTAQVVRDYAKKGITVFGAVIDGEVERIAEIYGEKTMDLTDLKRLPEELAALVRRYVTRR